MQVREIKPINFLFYRTKTKLDELAAFVPKAKDLFKEAVRLDLHPTGPVHWHYLGFDGNPSKAFTLEISLPISHIPADYDGPLHFKRTQSFKCVSTVHEGDWLTIPGTYGKIMEFIEVNKLHPSGNTRELYINVDFADPSTNVTEIQMGVL